jgi:hypothetical protein
LEHKKRLFTYIQKKFGLFDRDRSIDIGIDRDRDRSIDIEVSVSDRDLMYNLVEVSI